jgi:hypothetical protein
MAFNPEMIPRIGYGKLCTGIIFIKINIFTTTWDFANVDSRALKMGYESFMVKVGLYGNTMDHDYNAYSILVTNNTWYKNVWELIHYFNIRLVF